MTGTGNISTYKKKFFSFPDGSFGSVLYFFIRYFIYSLASETLYNLHLGEIETMKTNIIRTLFMFIICSIPTLAYSGVQLAMETNPSTVRPGGRINISITVVNDDISSSSGNITLQLHYPDHLNGIPVSYITTGSSANTVDCYSNICNSGEIVTWSLGNLPPGKGVTVTMPSSVNGNTANETLIQFDAEVSVDGVEQMTLNKTALVQTDPFFELTVDEETDPMTSSGNREYKLTYGSVSSNSSSTQLVFPLPTGTTFVSATGNGTETGGDVSWDIGSLTGGTGGERRVTVQVNAEEGDLLEVNSAYLNGMDSSQAFHQVQIDRISRVDDSERPAVAMSLQPNPVRPGEKMNVELTVTNPGSSVLSNVEILLRYPDHLNVLPLSYVTTGGSANTVDSYDNNCTPMEIVTWSLGNLPPGGGVTVTMPPMVNANTVDGTLIQFDAEVRVDGIQQVLLSKTALVQTDPFFELTVDEETDPMTSSGNREYKLTYGSVSSTSSSSSTQLVFPLPTGTTFISATGNGTETGGEVTWNIGSLTSGAGGEHRVTVRVNAEEGHILEVNSAYLNGTDSSYSFHQTQVDRIARIEDGERPLVAITLQPPSVIHGEILNVELTVTNPSSSVLSNVEILLRYPDHLNSLHESDISTGGPANTVDCPSTTCDSGEIVTWSLGNLPPGGGVTVTMPPMINAYTVDGTLIQFDAEVRIDGRQQVQISKTAYVGTMFTAGEYPDDKNATLFFPVKASNGKIVIIHM